MQGFKRRNPIKIPAKKVIEQLHRPHRLLPKIDTHQRAHSSYGSGIFSVTNSAKTVRGIMGKALGGSGNSGRQRKAFSNPVSSADSLNNSSDGEDQDGSAIVNL
jgi:hypothetical protein